MIAAPQSLLVSVLSLGRPDNVLRQMEDLPGWLAKFAARSGVACHIVIRNNDPNASFAAVAARLEELEGAFPLVSCTLVNGVPNNGFGGGHNSNMELMPSTHVLILNDDIGFPHLQWLDEAFARLQADERLACIGGEENPRNLNALFGNGLLPGTPHLHALPYAEASILLCRRSALERVGFFHADYAWAMCEDADLSLRLQQAGYRLGYIAMPHQHWRSTSFNALPSQVKSSILEQNRAALFANWHDSLTEGEIGRSEVFDLWSDGIGDVMCALPHVHARLAPLSPAQRSDIVINTSHPELFALLDLAGVRVISVPDQAQLRTRLRDEGIATLRSMRMVNFSLPFNIHPLLAGALGIETAGAQARAALAATLRRLRPPPAVASLAAPYCVLHLEFARDHEGRGLSPASTSALLALCAKLFAHVVLVGRERRLAPKMAGAWADRIIDLQGKLSLAQLAAVVARAAHFVGIDSFPAHLAQAASVPAAVVFGAVHPLTRAWQAARLWPITGDLGCIGCYHTQLEPSVPFCMRRDQACVTTIAADRMEAALTAMIAGRPHDFGPEEIRLQELQSRLLRVIRFHPAPPERLFRPPLAGNEQVSNLIYKMTEQMADLLRDQYQASAIRQLRGRVQELEADLFQQRIETEALARANPPASRRGALAEPDGPRGTRILKLAQMKLSLQRCRVEMADQWVEVVGEEDDPQILLPPIVASGKVQLRLTCILAEGDALQVYWSHGDEGFCAENVRTVLGDGTPVPLSIVFDPVAQAALHIRIDPTTGVGAARMHGTLGGVFVLAERPTEAEPPPLVPLQAMPPSRGAALRQSVG